MAMLMDPVFAEEERKGEGEREREKIQRGGETERRRGKGRRRGDARRGPGNGCVHIIPSVLLISSKDPTLRHFKHSRWSLQPSPLTLATGLIRRRQCDVFFSPALERDGQTATQSEWRLSVREKATRGGRYTLLPVLSGGMSRAAVNKCVSNSKR